jgi:hypothetical protein
MFKIFLKLIVTLLENIKVVVEWEQRGETLVALNFLSSVDLALFKLFFWIVSILRFDIKNIQYFIVLLNKFIVVFIDWGLEPVNLSFHFIEVFEYVLWRFRKVFNELCYLFAQDLVRIASDFSSDLSNGFINIIVISLGIQRGLYFEDCFEDLFHFLLHLAFFLADNSDITEPKELSKFFMKFQERFCIPFLKILNFNIIWLIVSLDLG